MSETTTSDTVTETIPEPSDSAVGSFSKGLAQSKLLAAKSLANVSKSSQFIWHTCLGSAATAEENLVSLSKSMAKKGAEIDTKAKAEAMAKMNKVKATAKQRKESITNISKEKIESVEKFISKGLNKSLHAAGVPTRGDLDKLALLMSDMSKSLEELTAVGELKRKRGGAAKAAPP